MIFNKFLEIVSRKFLKLAFDNNVLINGNLYLIKD